MIGVHKVGLVAILSVLSVSSINAEDLSTFWNVQLGTNLVVVAGQVGMNPADAKTLHQRPAMIQELWWHISLDASDPRSYPVEEIVFSFYNGELFRIVVTFDRNKTKGLTDASMVEAVSAKCGPATRPIVPIVLFSSSQIYNERGRIIAHWEDSHSSQDLYRSSNQKSAGLLILSKRLDTLAKAAVVEAFRLDHQESLQLADERLGKTGESQ